MWLYLTSVPQDLAKCMEEFQVDPTAPFGYVGLAFPSAKDGVVSALRCMGSVFFMVSLWETDIKLWKITIF